jgi:hypothetical protein
MVAFTAASVLTASALNSAFNAYTVNAQTGTTYTFVLTDQGGLVTASNASASTYTVPTNASVAYATGTRIELLNIGAGVVTLSPAGGVTLTGTTTVPQNGRVALVKQATNTWYISPLGGGGLTLITSSTFSAVASVSVNSCFSAAYENYRIVIGLLGSVAASNDLNLRVRAAGTDLSGAVYASSYIFNSQTGGPSRSYTAAGTSGVLGYTNDYKSLVAGDMGSPFATERTTFTGTHMTLGSGAASQAGSLGIVVNNATSYDGFSLISATGTITGTLRVYGYSN